MRDKKILLLVPIRYDASDELFAIDSKEVLNTKPYCGPHQQRPGIGLALEPIPLASASGNGQWNRQEYVDSRNSY